MPQLARSARLTNLRIASLVDHSIVIDPDGEPGTALPVEGKGSQCTQCWTKLSALIAA